MIMSLTITSIGPARSKYNNKINTALTSRLKGDGEVEGALITQFTNSKSESVSLSIIYTHIKNNKLDKSVSLV